MKFTSISWLKAKNLDVCEIILFTNFVQHCSYHAPLAALQWPHTKLLELTSSSHSSDGRWSELPSALTYPKCVFTLRTTRVLPFGKQKTAWLPLHLVLFIRCAYPSDNSQMSFRTKVCQNNEWKCFLFWRKQCLFLIIFYI